MTRNEHTCLTGVARINTYARCEYVHNLQLAVAADLAGQKKNNDSVDKDPLQPKTLNKPPGGPCDAMTTF
jgi:hypothetical protein